LKYCLLSFSRTGSTALEKVLGLHDDISHDFTRLPLVDNKRKWVYDFLDKDSDTKWHGFKCLLYQYDHFLEKDILKNNNIRKIIVLRHDIFQAAISKKVAEKINNWHVKLDYKNFEPFEIDKNWFVSYVKFVRENIRLWESVSSNYKVFFYEDLFFKEETYKPILEFLNIRDSVLDYTIKKTNDYESLETLVKNLKELKNVYEQIK
jgi:hypothetical protein